MGKDPEAVFFKRLEAFNLARSQNLKLSHIYLLSMRNELRQFEIEYRKALARFQEATNRYSQEKQFLVGLILCILTQVDELLQQRDSIQSSFTVARSTLNTSGSGHYSNGSGSKIPVEDSKDTSPEEEGSFDSKDKSSRKRWFNLNLKGSDKK
ncbi:hypothetical protein OROHE_009157 [Orobanche hederae]